MINYRYLSIVSILAALSAILNINAISTATGMLCAKYALSPSETSLATSIYLTAEIMAIPLLAALISKSSGLSVLKAAALGFLLSSFMCAFADNYNAFLYSRAAQGFFSGLLLPLPYYFFAKIENEKEKVQYLTVFSLLGGLAPIIGPMITTTITTETFPLLFLIPSFLAIPAFLINENLKDDGDKADKYWTLGGSLLLSVFVFGVGIFVWNIEHGQKVGWWTSGVFSISILSSAFAMLLAIIVSFKTRNKLLPFYLLKNKTTALIMFSAFANGLAIYGFLFIIPYYLFTVYSYSPNEVFKVLLYSAIPQIFLIFLSIKIRKYISASLMLSFGFLSISGACYYYATMGLGFEGELLLEPQLLRALGVSLTVPALSLYLMLNTVGKEGEDTTLFSLFRSLGGAIGVAAITSFVNTRRVIHFDSLQTHHATLNKTLHEKVSWIYAFNEAFFIIGFVMVGLVIIFSFVAIKNPSKSKGA